jgi:hypothetical protein
MPDLDRNGQPILFLCDEDLELLEVDAKKITNEQFEEIFSELQEYYNTYFMEVLQETVERVLGKAV